MTKLKMSVDLTKLGETESEVEPFDISDIGVAAELMVEAYRGTVDWEDGDDESVAAAEIENTLNDEYGQLVREATLQIRHGSEVVSQVMCSLFEGEPLIVFVYTRPDHAGHGHATTLIRAAGRALRSLGHEVLTLFVTKSNPAVALYESLGFRRV